MDTCGIQSISAGQQPRSRGQVSQQVSPSPSAVGMCQNVSNVPLLLFPRFTNAQARAQAVKNGLPNNSA